MVSVSTLIFEVTRKCNIKCSHCLRGNAMNMELSKEDVDTLLDQINNISQITFSGGEPSLNVPMLNYILEGLKKRQISVGSFYVATNGVNVSEEFVIFLLRMYSYCDDKEYSEVNYSNDYYHQIEKKSNIELLNGLSFFSKKYDKDGFNYNGGKYLIKQGRSKEGQNPGNGTSDINTIDDLNDCQLYVNCEGNVINGCDWSYTNQKKHVLCHVSEFTNFVEGLEE